MISEKSAILAVSVQFVTKFHNFLEGLGFASVDEVTHVLERVVAELAAARLTPFNEGTEALEVVRLSDKIFTLITKDSLEKLSLGFTVLDFNGELANIFVVSLFLGTVGEPEVLDITRVLSIALVRGFLVCVFNMVASLAKNLVNQIFDSLLIDALEVTDNFFFDGHVTELTNGRLVGLTLDTRVLEANGLMLRVVGFGVFHPVDGEEIAEARANFGAVNDVIRGAVSSPGGLTGIRGGHSIHVLVLGEVGEHRARLTSLNVHNHLAVEAVFFHVINGILKFISVQVS